MNAYVGGALAKTFLLIGKERKEKIKLVVSMLGEWFLRTSST